MDSNDDLEAAARRMLMREIGLRFKPPASSYLSPQVSRSWLRGNEDDADEQA